MREGKDRREIGREQSMRELVLAWPKSSFRFSTGHDGKPKPNFTANPIYHLEVRT